MIYPERFLFENKGRSLLLGCWRLTSLFHCCYQNNLFTLINLDLIQSRQSGATARQHQRFVVYVQDPAAANSSDTRGFSSVTNDGQATVTISDADQGKIITFLDATASRLANTCETDALLGETVYLGRNAPANFFRFMHPENATDALPKKISLESAFALTNRTTLHPFGSLWSTVDVTLADVLKALPAAETCMRSVFCLRSSSSVTCSWTGVSSERQ